MSQQEHLSEVSEEDANRVIQEATEQALKQLDELNLSEDDPEVRNFLARNRHSTREEIATQMRALIAKFATIKEKK